MSQTIDARGLSCPQPVIMTLDAIDRTATGEIVVLVDTDTSKENVSRAAESRQWQVDSVGQEDEGYRLILTKG